MEGQATEENFLVWQKLLQMLLYIIPPEIKKKNKIYRRLKRLMLLIYLGIMLENVMYLWMRLSIYCVIII